MNNDGLDWWMMDATPAFAKPGETTSGKSTGSCYQDQANKFLKDVSYENMKKSCCLMKG